ncbi:lysophospholipid acyltransferase family protein [Chloroflexota bacterium]
MAQETGFLDNFKNKLRDFSFMAPWKLVTGIFKLLYDLQVEGIEHIPEKGPFILAEREPSLIGVFTTGWLGIKVMQQVFPDGQYNTQSYMLDQLFSMKYFQLMQERSGDAKMSALIPHSAGRMAVNLVDGYRKLNAGGLVMLNPEGDGSWDGRQLPVGNSVAWLGLRTAVPIVPTAVSVGAYEIWPRWQSRPRLRGKLQLRIGEPFQLCSSPVKQISDEDLVLGTERIRKELEILSYGPAGVSGWIGSITHRGDHIDDPPVFPPVDGSKKNRPLPQKKEISPMKRGMAQLLWGCPVCNSNDALVHHMPFFGRETLSCSKCETAWGIQHPDGNDIRLSVTAGPSELMDLEMPLCIWYDQMKANLTLDPIEISGSDLNDNEEVYLLTENVPLQVHKPSFLFKNWAEVEAPKLQPRGKQKPGDWDSIGDGQIVLTNQGLCWREQSRKLDFYWESVTALYLWNINTLGIRYGNARYRIPLGNEAGLKWLTYAGTLLKPIAEQEGRSVTISTY